MFTHIIIIVQFYMWIKNEGKQQQQQKKPYKPNSFCPQSSFLSLCWPFSCVWTHSWWAWSVGIKWVELQVASQCRSVTGKPLSPKRIIPPRADCGKLWLNKPQLNDTHLAKKTRIDDPKIPVLISLSPVLVPRHKQRERGLVQATSLCSEFLLASWYLPL